MVNFDFDGLLPARFAKWKIESSNLVLNDRFSFETKGNLELIKDILERGLSGEFTLNQLQKLAIFDKTKQDEIKNQKNQKVLKKALKNVIKMMANF